MNIAICICTRKRQEGLKRLLGSLIRMRIPQDVNIKIVVVENDLENYSEQIVQSFSNDSTFPINYFLETRPGLSFARNRSVREASECDFCCFVDDDQEVDSDWLAELFRCQQEFDADGVWGQNPPVFKKDVPAYIRKFHRPHIYDYGQITKSAPTNCLLLRKSFLNQIEGPFDLRLNFAGGEDIFLTNLITLKGGIIRYTPKAKAYEIIPEERTTIDYIIKRTYRNSNSTYLVELLVDPNLNKLKVVTHLILRFVRGVIIIIPHLLFSKAEKLKGLIKIIDATGGLAFFLGFKTKFYQAKKIKNYI